MSSDLTGAWTSGSRDRILFFLAVAANLVLLYWPHVQTAGGVPHLDKVVHAATFASLAWTGYRVGLRPRWLVVVLVAHAVASEVVQETFLSERGGDPADAAADVIGVALGLMGGTWSHERAREGRRAHRAAARGEPGSR